MRPFRPFFRLGQLYRDREYDRERLKEMISAEAAEGGFGPPVIVPTHPNGIGHLPECSVLSGGSPVSPDPRYN